MRLLNANGAQPDTLNADSQPQPSLALPVSFYCTGGLRFVLLNGWVLGASTEVAVCALSNVLSVLSKRSEFWKDCATVHYCNSSVMITRPALSKYTGTLTPDCHCMCVDPELVSALHIFVSVNGLLGIQVTLSKNMNTHQSWEIRYRAVWYF